MNFKERLGPDWLSENGNRKFLAKDYSPENGYEMNHLTLLFLALLGSGVLLAFAVDFISQWIYLVIVFPLLMGLALGYVGSKICEAQKIRKPLAAGVIAIVACILVDLAMHGISYYKFQKVMNELDDNVKTFLALSAEEQAKSIEQSNLDPATRADYEALVEASKVHSFPEYFLYQAKQGVSISRHAGKGTNLGFYGTFIYWLVELGFLIYPCFIAVRETCAESYCGRCQNWKKRWLPENSPELPGDKTLVRDAFKSGDCSQIIGWIDTAANTVIPTDKKGRRKGKHNFFVFEFAHCDKCSTSSLFDIKVQQLKVDRHGRVKFSTVSRVSYPPESRSFFTELFKKGFEPIPASVT